METSFAAADALESNEYAWIADCIFFVFITYIFSRSKDKSIVGITL